MSTYVFGHRNPDTDAICAALAYAYLLRETDRPDAVAACCGVPNLRTDFVLQTAGLKPPQLMLDVRPTAEEICQNDVVWTNLGDTVYAAYERMNSRGLRATPVKGPDGQVEGLVYLLDLLKVMFSGDADPLQTRTVHTSLEKIRDVLGGTYQHAADTDACDDFIVSVGAMSATGFKERVSAFPAEKLLIVSGDRPTIQLPAIEAGSRCLVMTGGFELSEGLLHLAQTNNVTVIISPHDTATTTMLIKSARLIDNVVRTDFQSVKDIDALSAVKKTLSSRKQPIYPVLDDDQQLVGVLSNTDLINPKQKQLVLVDHNEMTQAVRGAEDADIIEVIDHHRLGGSLRSRQPIRFINEPVGSTCTIVSRMFRYRNVEPTKAIAICMASGIISDTLMLKSPTATSIDADAIEWLRPYCEIDLEEFAKDFFASGSVLTSQTPDEVINSDAKEFHEGDWAFSISQIEEITFDRFWAREDELQAALEERRRSANLDLSALMITDIATNSSLLMVVADEHVIDSIELPERKEGLYFLEGVVSRKKQLLPMMITLLDPLEKSPA